MFKQQGVFGRTLEVRTGGHASVSPRTMERRVTDPSPALQDFATKEGSQEAVPSHDITYVEGGALNDYPSPSVGEGQSSSNRWNDYAPDPFGWDSLPGSEHLPSKRGWTLPSGRSITAPFPGQEESYFRWSENKMAQHQRNIDALDAAYTVFMEGEARQHASEQRDTMRRQALYNINNGMGAVTAGMIWHNKEEKQAR